MMKKFFIALILLLMTGSVFLLAKDSVMQGFLVNLIESEYGLRLEIGSLKTGLTRPSIHIKDIILRNPSGFPDSVMLDIREIFVHYDLKSLFTQKIHLREMRLNLEECVVVKTRDGKLNISYLKLRKADEKRKKGPSAKIPKIHIDKLRLKIGKAIYKDYSRGAATPAVKEFDINIDEEFRDVEDLYTLGRLIIARTLSNTYIPKLANFDIDGLNRVVGDVIKASEDVIKKTGSIARETMKEAKQTLEDVTSGLKGILGSSLGGKER